MWLENLLVGSAAFFALIVIVIILLREQRAKRGNWKDYRDRYGDQ